MRAKDLGLSGTEGDPSATNGRALDGPPGRTSGHGTRTAVTGVGAVGGMDHLRGGRAGAGAEVRCSKTAIWRSGIREVGAAETEAGVSLTKKTTASSVRNWTYNWRRLASDRRRLGSN